MQVGKASLRFEHPAFVYGGIQIRPDTEEPEDADEDDFF